MNDFINYLISTLLTMGLSGTLICMILVIIRKNKALFKIISITSLLLLVLEISGCIFLLYSLSQPSITVREIIKEGILDDGFPGKVIMNKDKKLEQRNHEISVSPQISEINICIWDFAAVDGDYIEIINDGKPLGEPFMISNDIRTFRVSVKGDLNIKGVKDGGGGITYGLYVRETGESYFNDAPYGDFNIYTIKAK